MLLTTVFTRATRLFLCFIFIPGFLCSQIICNGKKAILVESATCNESSYRLVFEDDFEGTSLDSTKWKIISGVVRDPEHHIAQQWFSPKNIQLSNGTLKLISRRDTLINQCYSIWVKSALQTKCENFYFSAAQIDSREKFGHGIFEIRCKIPKAKGLASSFWTYGGPGANEIDVFEFENETNLFANYSEDKLAQVHNMNCRTDYEEDGDIEDCPTHYTGPDFSKEFHVFTLVWTHHKIEWYLDGELKRSVYLFYTIHGQAVDCNGIKLGDILIKNRAFPFNSMMIIADNIIQVGENAPDATTPFSNYFEIDYIRYYRKLY